MDVKGSLWDHCSFYIQMSKNYCCFATYMKRRKRRKL